MKKLNFIPAKQGSFSHSICLDLFTSFLVFLCKHELSYILIPLKWAETITWENFVPPKLCCASRWETKICFFLRKTILFKEIKQTKTLSKRKNFLLVISIELLIFGNVSQKEKQFGRLLCPHIKYSPVVCLEQQGTSKPRKSIKGLIGKVLKTKTHRF